MRLANLESLEQELAQAAGLARLLQERAFAFPEKVKAWLAAIESSLSANHLPQAGEVAAIRAGLISVEQGVVPSGLSFRGRATRSRVLNAAAVSSMQRATELLAHTLQAPRARFVEAEALAMQVVALARFKGLIPAAGDRTLAAFTGGDRQPFLRELWHKLLTTPELAGAAVKLEGLVGLADAFVCLDRALSAAARAGETGRAEERDKPWQRK